MKSIFIALFFLSAFAFGNRVQAEDRQNLLSLQRARVIFCTFDRSTRTDLIDGKLVPRESKEKREMEFDNIDFSAGKARLVATGGTVNAFITSGGATFFEGPSFDNHSFTTVFPVASATSGELIVVHSMHVLIPGVKLKSGEHFYAPEQRYGSCKVRP